MCSIKQDEDACSDDYDNQVSANSGAYADNAPLIRLSLSLIRIDLH